MALIISLLVNHGLLLPGAYLLFTAKRPEVPEQPAPMDVELVPPVLPDEADPARRPELERRRARRVLLARPPEPKADEKKTEKKAEEKKKEEQAKPVPQPQRERRLKMVEAPNEETDLPPENARFLSDKNRRVEQETRAVHTNLVREHPKPRPSQDPKAPRAQQPGSHQPKIAETRERQGKKKAAEEKKKKVAKVSPLLEMRAQAAQPGKEAQRAIAEKAPDGTLAPGQPAQAERKAVPGQLARRGLNLDHQSLDRIDGEEALKAREQARLSPSVSKGGSSFDQKWARVRAALENFIPEVRPGNQTALGTRADPFALYIARMHRKIHKFWGFGFLVDLDAKPDSNPMNDMSLWTMIEIVVAPTGKVEKATIVRPSGLLTFDVAALDTVFSAAPYENTPRAIRSTDGRVYVHWRFHRDQRQCGTFGVDPFILTTPPKGPIDNPATEVTGENTAGSGERQLRHLHRRPEPAGHQHHHPAPAGSDAKGDGHDPQHRHEPPPQKKTKAAPATRLDPEDPKAMAVAARFLEAFSRRNPEKMAAACALPFRAGGDTVARDRGELARMFRDLLGEAAGKPASGPSRLLTVAQARGQLGRLPQGIDPGDSVLLGLATLGTTPVTLIVEKARSGWQLIGLNR